MADQQEAKEGAGAGADVSNALVTAAVGALGDVVSTAGDPVSGAVMKSLSPLVGYGAGHGWRWLGRGYQRIAEFGARLLQKADAQGVAGRLEEVADLIEQAVPIIGDTATEEKRRMIGDLILNAARRSRQEGAKVEAGHALQAIDALPPEAALLFGGFVAAVEELPGSEPRVLLGHIPSHGLPDFLVTSGEHYLRGQFGVSEGSVRVRYTIREGLITMPKEEDGAGGTTTLPGYCLTPRGRWLADWIAQNLSPSEEPRADSSER